MKKTRRVSLRKIIKNLNLSEAEEVLKSKYKYVPGKPGRPPLTPIGMFLSFTIMFLRMESYRDFHAFLEKDKFWRRTLGFKEPPDIGSFSHFLNRIGVETFEQLFQVVVQQLLDEGFLNLHMIAQDGSILEANPDDGEAGWGWDHIKEEFVYGYKIHVTVDVNTELPVTLSVTKAGVHDSKEFQRLYTNVKSYKTRFPTRFYTADKAFDSSSIRTPLLRDEVQPIIKASRVNIKPHYSQEFLEKYKKRISVERFFSRLKEFLDLKKLGIYGKNNVLIYSYIIITGMLLTGYINSMFGFSPRSVKTFLRKFT
ncbi:MAG TPA: transposase [Archaeoglobus veneficus]|nr:transposase [Archaeoglobus veneficus]